MKSFFFILTACVVMALAVWAYRQNYETQATLREVDSLRDEIADLRERAGVLRAEWAYLNRPDRLRELAGEARTPRERAALRAAVTEFPAELAAAGRSLPGAR